MCKKVEKKPKSQRKTKKFVSKCMKFEEKFEKSEKI